MIRKKSDKKQKILNAVSRNVFCFSKFYAHFVLYRPPNQTLTQPEDTRSTSFITSAYHKNTVNELISRPNPIDTF